MVFEKLSIDLESPNSCLGYTDIVVTQVQDLTSLDYSSKVTQNTVFLYNANNSQIYYQSKLQPGFEDYWELLQQPDKIFYEPKVYKCRGDSPRFLSNLKNQVVQLPISSPQTYTFDFPSDCFNNDLQFTWSVDFYTTPPSFMTFSTNNKKATLSMNPTILNIGTYNVKVIFTNLKDSLVFSQDYFQVEVYPETSYTDVVKCLDCPSRPMAMAFGVQADFVIYYMDIDLNADYFILCGSKFIDGRVLKTSDQNLRADQMIIDVQQGDTYIMGKQTDTLIAFNDIKHVFLLKFDRFYEIQFFRFYENGPSEGREIILDQSNAAIFMIHTYLYSAFSKSYYAVVKADYMDGDIVWAQTLRDNSGQIYQQISTPNQQLGVRSVNNQLYTCLHYQTSGMTTSGTELYLSRHDLATGLVSSRLELGFTVGNDVFGCNLQYSTSSSQLLMQYGGTGATYIAFLKIDVTPMTIKSSLLKFNLALTTNNKQFMIEKNSVIVNDFTTPAWESPCSSGSIQTVDSSVYSGFNLPNGINGDQSVNWKNLNPYTSRLAKISFIANFFTQLVQFRAYPVTNTSADVRTNPGSCSKYSNPSFPQIQNRVGGYINSTAGSIPVSRISYSIIFEPFLQCSNDQITHQLKLSSGASLPSFMTYNSATNILTITPSSNTYQGIYSLRYSASLNLSPTSTNYTDIQIEISGNQAPYALEDFQTNVVIELDSAQFEAFILDSSNITLNPTPTWFSITFSNQDQISFSVIDPPQPLTGTQTQYYIKINIWDEWNTAAKRPYFISLIVKDNKAPYLTQTVPTVIPSIYITQYFAFSFPYSYVTDRENDTVSFICTTSNTGLSANWITMSIDTQSDISIKGQTPRNNQYAGTYTFTCQLKDQYDGDPNTYVFTLVVHPKPQVQILKTQQDISSLVPKNQTLDLTGLFKDPFNEPFTISITINSTLYNPSVISWLTWNSTTLQMNITGYNNSQGGNHSISIKLDDSITTPTVMNFKVEIIQNWPLRVLNPLKDLMTQANSQFIKSINITNLFYDPEGLDFTYYVQEAETVKQMPYFVYNNFPNGSFAGYASDANLGSYNLECVGVDNANQSTVFKFKFIVRPCYFKCQACWDIDYNACTECKQGFYFYFNECLDECFPGTYPDDVEKICKKCPSECQLCTGPDRKSECQRCKAGYFLYNNGCWKTCPDGFYGDKYEGVCKKCKVPKCKDKQYFDWFSYLVNGLYSGQCFDCHFTCKKCVGPSSNDCLQCILGYEFDEQNFFCTKCEDIYGYETNLEGECEDICGDGIIVEKQCDDGNKISGDGCNDQCEVEYEFTEEIYIENSTSISPENMIVSISGNLMEYIFSWRIVVEPNNPIIPNRLIKRFAIILFDFKQSLLGSETLSIKFLNETQIIDPNGNILINDKQKITNPSQFIYLTPTERKVSKQGGQTVKVSFLSVCSFNIAFKLLMNSSMQYLWGLVHALQVFNFLLYINIDFPENVELFSEYLSVASGDMEEFNTFIPNIADIIISQDELHDPRDLAILDEKFQDSEISPYFIIAFGQKLTLWCVGLLLILPLALLFHKMFKNVKFWEDIVAAFFFNVPLRTFVEMYIELILQVLINSKFIKIRNYSQTVSTLCAFVFGTLSLLLPFLAMTMIYRNRKMIKQNSWNDRFGMLTEEIRKRNIIQLYYYPIMMYQRLLISGIIVYFSHDPGLQCGLVLSINLVMIIYLIIYKPFKKESQQAACVIDELIIMLCVFAFLYIYRSEQGPAQQKGTGWFIIMLILISVIKNLCIVIYFGIIVAQNKYTKMFNADDEILDSPASSINTDESHIEEIETEDIHKEIIKDLTREISSRSTQQLSPFTKFQSNLNSIFETEQQNKLRNQPIISNISKGWNSSQQLIYNEKKSSQN
ncbi:cadg multi-domain protein [Stylonychia lemnae]|uniref:Cadg multi-domain protein n=1 Tax=Stylonychia lemnae TaxID=5949 RepID=A0A078AUH0_STYLE|nr:cadg multi-domain protein [Stylonychia lemnae]|eukprot:CDW85864.1 cadg multi-domain protein [Stylonychia lemnae]